MDEFHHRRQREAGLPPVTGGTAGEEQEGRPQTLAARIHDVARDLADQRHVRVQPLSNEGVDTPHVARNGRQHGQEAHDSLIIPGSSGL